MPIAALADAVEVDRLDARATALLARDVGVWLAIETPPPAAEGLEAWTATVAAISNRFGTRLGWLELRFTAPGEPRIAAFALKRAAVDLHAVAANARLLVGGPPAADPAWLERVYAEDVASYLDGVAAPVSPMQAAIAAAVGKHDPGATRGDDRHPGRGSGPVDRRRSRSRRHAHHAVVVSGHARRSASGADRRLPLSPT